MCASGAYTSSIQAATKAMMCENLTRSTTDPVMIAAVTSANAP